MKIQNVINPNNSTQCPLPIHNLPLKIVSYDMLELGRSCHPLRLIRTNFCFKVLGGGKEEPGLIDTLEDDIDLMNDETFGDAATSESFISDI